MMDHIIDKFMIDLDLFNIILNWLPSFLSNSFWSIHLLTESILSILNRFHDFSILSIFSVIKIIFQSNFLVIHWFFISNWFWNLNSLNFNLLRCFCFRGFSRKWDFLLVSCFSWSWSSSNDCSFWCLSLNNFNFSGYSFYLNWFLNGRLNWLNWGGWWFSNFFLFVCNLFNYYHFFISICFFRIFFVMMMLFLFSIWITWWIRITWWIGIVMMVFLFVVVMFLFVVLLFLFWFVFSESNGGNWSINCGDSWSDSGGFRFFCFLDKVSWWWNVKTNWSSSWVSVWSFDGFSWATFLWKVWDWN